MRLGGPTFVPYSDPAGWIAALRHHGYTAAFCPVGNDADAATIRAYEDAAAAAGIVIAEVGAWSNPMSPDEAIRAAALDLCKRQLALADQIGARCCVNIAGSLGEKWDGPCALDLTQDTFDLIVETTRDIIDSVKPTRSWYTLETMPWMYPDSADSYLQLFRAIDRERFAVHMDPVNLVNCPSRYFNTGALIADCFDKLGPHIKSCHGKDIALGQNLTVHLDEVRPGLGNLDYRAFLTELSKLDRDTPLMLEHLPNEAEFALAGDHVRGVAGALGLGFA